MKKIFLFLFFSSILLFSCTSSLVSRKHSLDLVKRESTENTTLRKNKIAQPNTNLSFSQSKTTIEKHTPPPSLQKNDISINEQVTVANDLLLKNEKKNIAIPFLKEKEKVKKVVAKLKAKSKK